MSLLKKPSQAPEEIDWKPCECPVMAISMGLNSELHPKCLEAVGTFKVETKSRGIHIVRLCKECLDDCRIVWNVTAR